MGLTYFLQDTICAAAPSQATLAANLKQATDLAAKLKDQVAPSRAAPQTRAGGVL